MIKAHQLCKSYPVFRSLVQRATYFFSMGYSAKPNKFDALIDISLSVGKGESLGIIGENGSGKSTLLKIIAGATHPTSGQLAVNGRVAALLELGAGFYPDLTGQENISLYLRLFQENQAKCSYELSERISLIEQFAELGEYFNRPVRTYSTGMQMRLAFSAASFVDPDILIVDEALAVGDAYFQQKCLDKIDNFRKQGVSILFVSHSMPLIEMFCNRAIFLKDGRIIATGTTTDVVREYENYVARSRGLVIENESGETIEEVTPVHTAPAIEELDKVSDRGRDETETINESHLTQTIGSIYGNGKIRFTQVVTSDINDKPKSRFEAGEIIRIKLDYNALDDYPNAVFGISIFRIDGIYITGTNNHEINPQPLPVEKGEGSVIVDIGPLNLHNGTFFITASVYTEPQSPLWPDPAEYRHKQYEFHIIGGGIPHGCVKLNTKWQNIRGALQKLPDS